MGLAVADRRQLPSQVGRVADTAVEALAGKGGHHVGRVAGQEHVAPLEGFGEPGVEGVHDTPLDVHVGTGSVSLHQGPDAVFGCDLVGIVAGHEKELPPAAVVGNRQADRRTLRVAVEADVAVRVEVVLEVDDHPSFVEGEPGELDTETFADAARPAVTGDDVPGLQRFPLTVTAGGDHLHVSLVINDVADLDAASNLDTCHLRNGVGDDPFQFGLVERAKLAVAESIGGTDDLADLLAGPPEVQNRGVEHQVGGQFLVGADLLEEPQGFGVIRDRPGDRERVGSTFENHRVDPGLTEHGGQRQSGGAGADNKNLAVEL